MALLSDQIISSFQDWILNDSKLAVLVAQEPIPVETKSLLAQQEIETQLTGFLLRCSGLQESAARNLLGQVAVTEPLRRWHINQTLHLFYNDLAALQNNANHRDQASYFLYRSNDARDQLYEVGVGIVNAPVAKAPVPERTNYGSGGDNRVLRARAQFVAWNGTVGTASDEFILDMSLGQQYTLTLRSDSNELQGWRLYLGENSSHLTLAQEQPFHLDEAVIVAPHLPATAIPLHGDGQKPDRYIRQIRGTWR
jgi:hypothetical protein